MSQKISACVHSFVSYLTIHPFCKTLSLQRKVAHLAIPLILSLGAYVCSFYYRPQKTFIFTVVLSCGTYVYNFYYHPKKTFIFTFVSFGMLAYAWHNNPKEMSALTKKISNWVRKTLNPPSPEMEKIKLELEGLNKIIADLKKNNSYPEAIIFSKYENELISKLLNAISSNDWTKSEATENAFAWVRFCFGISSQKIEQDDVDSLVRDSKKFVNVYHIFRQASKVSQGEGPSYTFTSPDNIPEMHSKQFYDSKTVHHLARKMFNFFIDKLSKYQTKPAVANLLAGPFFQKDLTNVSYKKPSISFTEKLIPIEEPQKKSWIAKMEQCCNLYLGDTGPLFKTTYLPTDNNIVIAHRIFYSMYSQLKTTLCDDLIKSDLVAKEPPPSIYEPQWNLNPNLKAALEVMEYGFVLAIWSLNDFSNVVKAHNIPPEKALLSNNDLYILGRLREFANLYHVIRQAANLERINTSLKFTAPNKPIQNHAESFYVEGTPQCEARLMYNDFIDQLAQNPSAELLLKHALFTKDTDISSYKPPKIS